MKRNAFPTSMPGLLLSLASLTLLPVSGLKADIFTKITTGPGADFGPSFGGGWGDYDNDGFIDLFVANGSASSLAHFLYHNNGDGTFSRVTTGPVAAVFSAGMAAAWGDYDNNGYLDLALTNWSQQNFLFQNNGAGSFAAVPSSFSSDIVGTSRGVTWVDYDNDGYVDLFRTAQINDIRRLYRNKRDGTFERITEPEFLTVPGGFIGMAWADYNNDGRPDLFLPQVNEASGHPNYLYRNDGGGAFTRVANPDINGNSNSTAAAWGDSDNDGDPDLFVSCGGNNGVSRLNLFYRNDGNGTFTSLTTLPANDLEFDGGASHGCNWGDYDNDGWLDLFVVNHGGQNDFLYHNNGDGTFTKIVGDIAVSDATSTWAPLWGDYDRDGSLDLFVINRTGNNLLYHNNGNANHWMEFRLIGTRSNRAAIGAKVRVHSTINGQSIWQMREVPGGDGQMGQNSLYLHVGLGNATTADVVRIEWPSGTVQELQNVAANEFHTVTEPGGEPLLTSTRVNGQQQLTLTGKQGCRYDIGTSTDLTNWNNDLMVTVINTDGTLIFPAPGETSDPRRFFRAALK